MKGRGELTHERLLELLVYDSHSGIFRWRLAGKGRRVGDVAGYKQRVGNRGDERINIGIDYKLYRAHRLAWFYVQGVWPKWEIDHIDGNPSNNAIVNLRDVDHSENQRNRHKVRLDKSSSELMGVERHREKWSAKIMIRGHRKNLGVFETKELAHAAYVAAKEAAR